MKGQHTQKPFNPGQETSVYWCPDCNIPLITKQCSLCNSTGERIELGPPGDVRFCSPYERSVLHDILTKNYGTDPLGERIILLNKIGGEDKTDQVIVDGMMLGILRFDLKYLDWRLDLSMDGGTLMAQHTSNRTVELSDVKGHLSGKTVGSDMILWCSDDISEGDDVIIRSGNMTGVGTALLDATGMGQAGVPAVRVRKIGRGLVRLKTAVPTMDDIVKANAPAIKQLGRDAMNTIKGLAHQQEYRGSTVYVSFSGGKDSLVVLDLTRSALKRSPKACFINTGLEFPETVEYARTFCRNNDIELDELDAGDVFWEHLPNFGPPAKDYRWCCKVCKLSPAGRIAQEGKYLTMDGKRRYESFSRARIPPKEENTLVPGQVNVYPIRDWRALEVWLYIHWRGLDYNPLYDDGFERVGCWLCPAALGAEYRRMHELHPDLYDRWDTYLHDWARHSGLAPGYIDRGFWRWREHPPKMQLLARKLGIDVVPRDAVSEDFQISMVSGVSPCKAGGYSIEGSARGVRPPDAMDMMKMVGEVRYSDDLGVLVVRTREGTVKVYADGTFQVNGGDRVTTERLFEVAARQLTKAVKCTGCRICEKACPRHALSFEDGHIRVDDGCDRCGKCDGVCVVTRYMGGIGTG
ncbi:MAG: phosphoadenosine phosphosulfate reductase family protein [ANME-2 cluster archaeon]|nr:phosphoadenosine phosphosulfate reductase family protein [ANME-2 cluster archaeon]